MGTHVEDIFLGVILGTFLLLFFVGIFIFAILQSQKKQLKNKLEKSQMQQQFEENILQAQIEIQNQTLQHIGQELHDNIGQLLSLARLYLNIIEDDHTDNESVINYVNQTNKLVEQSITEVRSLSKSLDGNFVRDFGLLQSLRNEVLRLQKSRLFSVDLVISGQSFSLGFNKEIVLFRVIQEIINNIIKHAKAKHIQFNVEYLPDLLTITINDNGVGFDHEAVVGREMNQAGAGLRNIQSRIQLLGGQCQIQSQPGQGTIILLSCPGVSA
jgi:two-component system, NarL family, sensor kinase